MAHIALYRKWRPMTFEDVVEQGHIVTTLKNSIKNNTINHAYLFCGTRGTGKTTLAKILARAVNCQYSKEGSPCNECITCKGILEGSLLDVIEIDAASNNGVDDVREIKEAVMYVPAITKYKVYIIDEVHMLSTGAFNALLKTLEEPPSNVIFILATTEPHKLPATILSRCQRFDFKRITISGMEERLKVIAQDCVVNAEEGALRLIARLSEGGMRDAISLLDQCIAQGETNITYQGVAEIAGLTATEAVNAFARAIVEKNASDALRAIKDAMDEGRELIPLCNQLIDYFRNLMLYKTGGEALDLIDLHQAEMDSVKNTANLITIEQTLNIIVELSQTEGRLKWADNSRIIMEATAVKLCSDIPAATDLSSDVLDSLSSFEDRIRQIEERMTILQKGENIEPVKPKKTVQPSSALPNAKDSKMSSKGSEANKKEPTDSSGHNEYLNEWQDIIEAVRSMKRMKIYAYLLDTRCILVDNQNVNIVVPAEDASKKPVLSRHENIEVIKAAIKSVLGIDAKIRIVDDGGINSIHSGKNADSDLERVIKFAEENDIPLKIED